MKLNTFEDYDTHEFLQLTKECDKCSSCENCKWYTSFEEEYYDVDFKEYTKSTGEACGLDWDTYVKYLEAGHV